MLDDDESKTAELLCSECEGPVYFDPDKRKDPQTCMCPDEERPDSWRIISKNEAISRAEAFL